jgi:hypothetical protein
VSRARLAGLALALGAFPGCQETVITDFPPGFEPWEEHVAPRPGPEGDDPCPERLEFERSTSWEGAINFHATGCIHAPIEAVWASAQLGTWSRDPTTTSGFMEIRPPDPAECDGDYQTYVFVDDVIDVEFRNCWRHAVALGTDQAPELTATRWQKVWGSSFLRRLEGSLVLLPLEGHPDMTEVRFQYHLDAVASNDDTVRNFLGVIYGRLRDHANGVPLDPP